MAPVLESAHPVLGGDAPSVFSPSSLAQFCKCPRMFLYQTLLRLPQLEAPLTTKAGSIAHKLLETLNRHFTHAYTLPTLVSLTHQVFEAPALDTPLQNLGLTAQDLALWASLGPVGKPQVLRSLLQAFENLAASGYFDRSFVALSPELWVVSLPLPGFPQVSLQGRIDLLREAPDGRLEIIDYKTSRSAKQRVVMAEMEASLAPYPEESPWYPGYFEKRHLQLPLYWWMLTQTPSFAGREIDITIQPVRPAGWGKAKATCDPVTLTHSQLESARTHLETTLLSGIIGPLMATHRFNTEGVSPQTCQYCPYTRICEGPTDEGDLPMGEED